MHSIPSGEIVESRRSERTKGQFSFRIRGLLTRLKVRTISKSVVGDDLTSSVQDVRGINRENTGSAGLASEHTQNSSSAANVENDLNKRWQKGWSGPFANRLRGKGPEGILLESRERTFPLKR